MFTPCYTEAYPIFQRAMRVVTAITNAYPAAVTTSIAHQYETGMRVRLIIPPLFGMQQANNKIGSIVVTGATSFTINLDTTLFDPFSIPEEMPEQYTCAQVVPIAEENAMLSSATQNVLPYPAT